jgi:plasmid stabilization system protein ParE
MNVSDVIILREASEDLQAGFDFYENREIGIGSYFIDCLISDIESLYVSAGIHNRHFGFMRMFSKRFPYAIYYDIDGSIARVVAVLDMRMNPESIRNFLGNR